RLGLGGRTSRGRREPTDLPATTRLIIEGANAFRQENKLRPLKPDSRLTKAAAGFAAYLAEHGELSHEADGRHPADRASEAGYDYAVIAENIADEMNSSGFTPKELADGFVEGWKQSPSHRKNLLDADVTQTGVAIAYRSETDTYYAVQMFGRSRTAEITFRITNKTDGVGKYKLAGRETTLASKATSEYTQPAARDVVFVWPAGKVPSGGKRSFRPKDGDHLIVHMDAAGRFEVKTEAPPRNEKRAPREAKDD